LKPRSNQPSGPLLRAGDRVRVVAPAGPVEPDLLAAGIARLRSWDLDVTVAAHVTDRHPALRYLAGTDTDRAADLLQAWCDPRVDAVWCALGGYGCVRLLPYLDWPALAAAPKTLIGSSDVTALHHALTAGLGIPTVFGPMAASRMFSQDAATRDNLRRCLLDPGPHVITGQDAQPLCAATGGVAHGVTSGGTASMLAALAGVPGPAGLPPPAGAILLLEDITESPYRLDRILTQLTLAGWLDRVAGIALGSWTGCGPLSELRAMLTDRLAGLGVPVAWGLRFGHCEGQASIRLGVPAVLNADAGTLTVG
jgi:muramoyltetrapeptide carboxypeptidase